MAGRHSVPRLAGNPHDLLLEPEPKDVDAIQQFHGGDGHRAPAGRHSVPHLAGNPHDLLLEPESKAVDAIQEFEGDMTVHAYYSHLKILRRHAAWCSHPIVYPLQ